MMNHSKPMLSSNPALNVLKTIGSSPLFLVATILYTVSLVGSIVLSVTDGGVDLTAMIYSYADQFGMDPSQVYPYLQASQQVSPLFSLLFSGIASIPTVLICVGMWITWGTCRSRASGGISTTGLTLCKGVFIFLRVLLILALVGCGGGLIGSLVLSFSDGPYSVPAALGVLMMILFAVAILILVLCYYISLCRTINRIRATAQTGIPDNRISGFLTGMLWFAAVGLTLSSIGMLFVSPLSGLLRLCSAAAAVCIALCLKKYREQMYYLMYPPVQPVYAQPYPQGSTPSYPLQQGQPWTPPAAPYIPQEPVQPQAPAQPQNPTASGEQPQDPWDDKPQE